MPKKEIRPGKRPKKPAGTEPAEEAVPALQEGRDAGAFYIVGIGASAGGLEAFEQFFSHMPADSGMAFVLVPHLDPTHISMLPELLQKYTKMNVRHATDGMKVEPDSVYIVPPNKDIAILQGTLQLIEPVMIGALRMPIDFFFRSLAQDQGKNAICVILSGGGTDGSLGLKAIRGEGGMVMVQDPKTAKYDGMPRSAIATGLADYILPADKMPEQLVRYTKHAAFKETLKTAPAKKEIPNALQKIFVLIRERSGHDFSLYKKNTIIRRIERRMNVHQINGISNYVRYMQQNPAEIDILFRELLIGVTSFFRDAEAFAVMEEKVLPELLKNKPNNYTVRAWVPGCATGEEAYSLAIVLRECMDKIGHNINVQIFATDIDTNAINIARRPA